MEVSGDMASYMPFMDITVTVRYERGNIIDILKLPGCCHGYKSPLTLNFQEDCEENATLTQQDLQDVQTHSSAVQKSSEESNLERKSDGGTCANLNLHMYPMLASCLTAELRRSRNFESSFRNALLLRTQMHVSVCRFGSQTWKQRQDVGFVVKEEHLYRHINIKLWLNRTQKYFRMEPDIRWSVRMLPQWILRAQMEDAFSWLSTLGGAYSSLGENMYNCALEAGRVALRQLFLAECLGDDSLKSRCLLYIALSLMQRGHLSKAKKLVRQQYRFATSKSTCQDTRLVCMCQGIWHHLRHHYAKRKET